MATTTKTRGTAAAKAERQRDAVRRLSRIVRELDELASHLDLPENYRREISIAADDLAGPAANLALSAILY